MSNNADISLLIGAAGGVTPNGESGALIQKQITAQLKDGVTIKINTAKVVKDIQAALSNTTFRLNVKPTGVDSQKQGGTSGGATKQADGQSGGATKKVKDLTSQTIALNNAIGQAYQLSKGFNKYVSTLSTKQVDALKTRIAAVNKELEKARQTGDRLALSNANRNIKNIKYITDDPADVTRNRKTVAAAKLELQKFQSDMAKLSADVQKRYGTQISKITSGFNAAIGTGKTSKLDDARIKLKALKQELADLPNYVKNSKVMGDNIDKARVALTNFNTSMQKGSPDALSRYSAEIQKIRTLYGEAMASGNTAKLDEANMKVKELAANMRSVATEAQKAAAQTKNMTSAKSGLADFNKYIQRVAPKGVAAYSGEIKKIRDLFNEVAKTGDAGKLTEVQRRVKTLKSEFVSLGYEGGNAISYMHDKLKTFSIYLLSSTMAMAFVKGLKDAISTVYDMDAALTDLRIVMNSGVDEAQALLQTYNGMAQSLGTTTKNVAAAAVEWQRQGYNLEETNTLIKDSMILSITGFIDSEEAATALTSAMKGYKLSVDEALGVVDKFVATDQVAATSAGDLAIALSKTAANAKLAGLSLDQVIGQLAVVNEVMQEDPESTGTFYNTMLSRMGMIKSGRLMDPESGESLSDVENTLSSLGIKLRDSGSEFRNFGDILNEVGGNWESYSSVQQRAIASAFAGTRQQTRFLSLMSNWNTALKYTEVAAGSAGTAVEKFGVYEESLEAKTNRVTAAFEKMSMALIPSGLIGGVLDFAAAALDVGSALGGLPVTIVGVTTAVIALKAIFDAVKKSSVGASVKQTMLALKTFVPSLGAAGVAATAFAGGEAAAAIQTDVLRGSLTLLTPAKVANLAATKNLTEAELEAVLVKAQLDAETKESIMSQYADIAAKKQNAAATRAVTVASVGLKGTLKGIGALIVANPLSAILIGLTVLLPLIVKIGDALHTSREELQENFDEAHQAVEELNGELQTTQNRIDELSKKGPLTTVEEEELARLKQYNEYLEQRLELLSREEKAAAQKVNDSVVDEYDDWNNTPKQIANENGMMVAMTGEELYDHLIAQYKDYLNQRYTLSQEYAAGNLTDDEFEMESMMLERSIQAAEKNIGDLSKYYSDQADALQDVNGEFGEYSEQYEFWSEQAAKGLNALTNPGDAFTTDVLGILNQPQFSQVRAQLSALATQGKLTAEAMKSPAYQTFVDTLDEMGIVSKDSDDDLENLAVVIGRVSAAADKAADDTDYLTTAIDNFGAANDKIEKIGTLMKELKENTSGKLSGNFLAELYALLPGLAGRVNSVKEAQEALEQALVDTKEIARLAYGQMLISNTEWLETTINNSSRLQTALAMYYRNDLSNWQKNAQAKWIVDSRLVGDLSGLWSKYMNASDALIESRINMFEDVIFSGPGWESFTEAELEEYRTLKTVLALRKESAKAFEQIDFTPTTLNTSKTSTKEIEKYMVAIEDFREALKRLKDVQDEISIAEIKFDMIDEDDIEAQKVAINHLIALYKEEQAALHNLNNERDAKIAEITKELNKYGLGAEYDPKTNEFWVKNLEKINQVVGYGKNGKFSQEVTNQLRKHLEELVKLATEYADANIEGSEEWWNIQKKIYDLNSQVYDMEQELYEQRIEALEKSYKLLKDLVELEKDRIKQAGEDLIDKLNDEIDAYDEIINRQKELLELQEREKDHEEAVADAVDEIAKLQAKADALAMDDSRSAQLQRAELLEQIAEKQKELDDLQHDYAIENTQDALDEELDEFKKNQQDKIDAIEDFLNDQQKLTDLAYDNIEKGGQEAFDKLLAYCLKYTDVSRRELLDMWNTAIDKIKEYGSLANALGSMSTEIDISQNGTPVSVQSKINEMKANAKKWNGASEAERGKLEERNEELAAEIEHDLGIKLVRGGDGRWYYGSVGGTPVFHTGGIVGGMPTARQKEMMVLAEKGEMMLNSRQQENIGALVTAGLRHPEPERISARFSGDGGEDNRSYSIDASITVQGGMVDDAVLGTIEKHQRKVANILNKIVLKK